MVLDVHRFSGSERVIDVGSGGGIPGIPLKLAAPGITLTLVESDRKKAAFLRDVAAELGLESVTVEARRAEELGRDTTHRQRHDVALTRAIAQAPVAAEYCLPLVRVGGVLLALAREGDWRAAAGALNRLGGQLRAVAQGVVMVDKVRSTPEQFPRRVGVPRKRPLS